MMKLSMLFAGLVAATALQAAPVYDNTTKDKDTGDTVFYSPSSLTEIGDQIHLAGTERIGNRAKVQFYNGGLDGTFNATLNLYSVVANSPNVGALLQSFASLNNAIGGGITGEVVWSLGGLALLDDMVFTVTIDGFSSGVDLGLTLFEPPAIGSSENSFLIVRNSSGFAHDTTGSGHDNVYFLLDASSPNTVPEPGTGGTVMLAMLSLFAVRARRKGFTANVAPV